MATTGRVGTPTTITLRITMTTARLLQALISAHPGTTTQRSVAAFLGEHEAPWGRYVTGVKTPGEVKIDAWLATCRAGGLRVPVTVADAIADG